jgi:hypothetical protein
MEKTVEHVEYVEQDKDSSENTTWWSAEDVSDRMLTKLDSSSLNDSYLRNIINYSSIKHKIEYDKVNICVLVRFKEDANSILLKKILKMQ